MTQATPRKTRIRPFLLLILGILIIAEIVALSPSSIEESKPLTSAVEPDRFLQDDAATLAPGIPKNRLPEYSVEKFNYVSVQKKEKQWKIVADRAFLFNPERLVHSRVVQAHLYDSDNKVTLVTGKEAKYFMNQKDLEVYGNVKTTFPDGFILYSEYLRYKPDQHLIEIPVQYSVRGVGEEKDSQSFQFTSQGIHFVLGQPMITLEQSVVVTLERKASPVHSTVHSAPDQTTILSDHCVIHRDQQKALFTMNPTKPLPERFVHITQPTLFSRSRHADLYYGDFNQVLHYLTAFDDVLIKETKSGPVAAKKEKDKALRYATSGRADFDNRKNLIVLTRFPQVYQNDDTVTGDIILMHRDTDIVEVEHSNAFSEGTPVTD